MLHCRNTVVVVIVVVVHVYEYCTILWYIACASGGCHGVRKEGRGMVFFLGWFCVAGMALHRLVFVWYRNRQQPLYW